MDQTTTPKSPADQEDWRDNRKKTDEPLGHYHKARLIGMAVLYLIGFLVLVIDFTDLKSAAIVMVIVIAIVESLIWSNYQQAKTKRPRPLSRG